MHRLDCETDLHALLLLKSSFVEELQHRRVKGSAQAVQKRIITLHWCISMRNFNGNRVHWPCTSTSAKARHLALKRVHPQVTRKGLKGKENSLMQDPS